MDLTQITQAVAARQPGHALPQYLYNAPEALAFDMAAVFGQSWLLAGFSCEVARAGERLAFTIGEWPVLVVRGRDGMARAFHNSCRHRGSVLCAEGHGHSARLTCPYHHWTYDLDGRLLSAAKMGEGFDKRSHGLGQIACEEVAGAVFICLADTPPPFAEFRARIAPMLAPHRLDEAKLAHQSVLVEAANWKLVMENARECYHCGIGHPELAPFFPIDKFGEFDNQPEDEAFVARMEAAGLPSAHVGEDWWEADRFALTGGAKTLSMDGQFAVRKLMCDVAGGDIGSLRWALEPNVFVHSTADVTFAFIAMPIGPRETHVVARWLVHKDAVEGADYQLDALIDLWTRTNLQDRALAEANQRGVNSPGYRPGPYAAEDEGLVINFSDWYCTKAKAWLARTG